MSRTRLCLFTVALLVLACVDLLYADSYYPLRPEDPRAVYLTKDQFEVHADGIGDDANAVQQAIDHLQETARVGVVFIPEGRYRLGQTIYVWQGIRLIGYGQKRPVFVLGKDTPGFQEGTGKYMVHFADYRSGPGRPFSDASDFSLNVAESNSTPQAVAETAEKLPDTMLLLPVGLHNMLSILRDLMEHRDYVYRQGSNTAVISVSENAHRGYFYAPGTNTAIFAGGTWRPILQSSSLAVFSVRREHYVTSEDDGKTYRVSLDSAEQLTTSVFAERGGTSVINDAAGNVYIAGDQIYIYNREGRQIGVLESPERPGSLAFGGPDLRTLFIGARTSLYSIRLAARRR